MAFALRDLSGNRAGRLIVIWAACVLVPTLQTGAHAQDSSVMQELDFRDSQLLRQLDELQQLQADQRGADRRDDQRRDDYRREDLRRDDLRREADREAERRREIDEDERRAQDRARQH